MQLNSRCNVPAAAASAQSPLPTMSASSGDQQPPPHTKRRRSVTETAAPDDVGEPCDHPLGVLARRPALPPSLQSDISQASMLRHHPDLLDFGQVRK